MMIFNILLSTLLIYSVKSDNYTIKESTYHIYSKLDFDKYNMLSSMSAYYENDNEECKPVRLWMCARHGTKYPSDDILNDIKENIPNIQNSLKALYEDKNHENYTTLKKSEQILIDSLIEWKNVLDNGTHKNLNNHGKLTMEEMGKKLNDKFKKLINEIDVKNEIEVLSAIEERCFESAEIFLTAFLNTDLQDYIKKNTSQDSRLKLQKPNNSDIKVHDFTKNDENKLINVEDLYFKIKYPEIQKRIGQLLFPNHIVNCDEKRKELSSNMIKTMYYACAHSFYYDNTNGNSKEEKKNDAWCKVFNFEDFRIFEEMYDLQYYNKNGYYNNNTAKLGNAIVEDMLIFLKKPNGIKFKYFSGHTSNCLSIITRLNLYRDKEKLTVNNIERMTNRKWKTSKIAPFSCNVMVVIYDCNREDLQVTIFINDDPLEVVIYNEYGTFNCVKCPLNEIVKILLTFGLRDKHLALPPSKKDKAKKAEKEKKSKDIDVQE